LYQLTVLLSRCSTPIGGCQPKTDLILPISTTANLSAGQFPVTGRFILANPSRIFTGKGSSPDFLFIACRDHVINSGVDRSDRRLLKKSGSLACLSSTPMPQGVCEVAQIY